MNDDDARSSVQTKAPDEINKSILNALPSVEESEGYERLSPGYADRMLKMAERDQEAFIESQKEKMRRDDRFRIIALLSGSVGLVFILGFAAYLALTGHDGVAIAVVGMGASGIVATLVNAASPFRPSAGPADAKQGEET